MNKIVLTFSLLALIMTAIAQPPRGGRGFNQEEMVEREKEMVLTKVNDLSDDQKMLVEGIYEEFAVTLEETVDEIRKSESYYSDKNIIAFKFFKDENEIILFFDKKTLNLKGWQTIDLYQNLNIVYLSSISINQKIEKKKFELPSSDLKNQ